MSEEVVPTCKRHPGTETRMSCRLCETPICPACMKADHIGFQCPTCAGENTQRIRNFQPKKAVVTNFIIGICVAVFVWGEISGFNLPAYFALAGYAIDPMGEYYRFITAMFLHGSIMHIVFNMLILHNLGNVLEPGLGVKRFVLLYFASGLGGGIASITFNNPLVFSVGASGAIFGLMGAFAVLSRDFRFDNRQIMILIGINLVIGFVVPGIDWMAHLGGLVTGAVLATIFQRVPIRR
jgi:membrane associated rhomboid family serine protease